LPEAADPAEWWTLPRKFSRCKRCGRVIARPTYSNDVADFDQCLECGLWADAELQLKTWHPARRLRGNLPRKRALPHQNRENLQELAVVVSHDRQSPRRFQNMRHMCFCYALYLLGKIHPAQKKAQAAFRTHHQHGVT